MIQKVEIPEFNTKKELFRHLVEHKDKLIAQKKSITKQADGFGFISIADIQKCNANKAGSATGQNIDVLDVKAVINTTNIMDSHYDVHLPGLWKKSIQENKMIMHVQEHQMYSLKKIISDGEDLKVSTKDFNWSELGYNFQGKTQALLFESKVRKSRNSFMFDQYNNKYVRNHSVGMRYMKIIMCINDEEYGAEFEAWGKYFPQVANKDFAEDKGFFWAVKEAKVIEGSAVPLGSNQATPTISVEAGKSTQLEKDEADSQKSLQEQKVKFYLNS